MAKKKAKKAVATKKATKAMPVKKNKKTVNAKKAKAVKKSTLPVKSSALKLPTRPTSVSVIAWIFIILAGLGVLGSIFGTGMFQILMSCIPEAQQSASADPGVTEKASVVFRIFASLGMFLLKYPIVIGIILGGIYGYILYSAIKFLKQKAWARKVLEVVTWIYLVFVSLYVIVYGALFVTTIGSVPADADMGFCLSAGSFMTIFSIFFFVMMIAFYIVPAIFIMKYLRSKPVRDAMVQ